jgi:hypothetical protein
MDTKTPKNEHDSSVPAAKKPYEAPQLKEWGTLKDITLTQGSGTKSDGGSIRSTFRYTH